jgi:ABC-2 type transport system permease protein
MMSSRRVLTIVGKDMAWARGNFKLLGVMILPLFVVVLFSQMDSAATFGFSLIFVNAFVGIFSTSYLIIEEKNKGTLLALLTSPLTGAELLLGKFLFSWLLCSVFSLLVIVLNQRMDLLAQPLALLNLFLFSGTACFFGFVTGVFFKNEQEMSVLAPFLMFLFCFGDAAKKVSVKNNIHAFFPDYHLLQSVRDLPLNWRDLWVHSLFSLLMFAVAFGMATFYTRFYFSNNREKRYSHRLLGFITTFFLVLIVSGWCENSKIQVSLDPQGLQELAAETTAVHLRLSFEPEKFHHKSLLQSRRKIVELLNFKKNEESNIVLTVRWLEDDEMTWEKRRTKVEEDRRREIITVDEQTWFDRKWRQWIYLHQKKMILLRESFCGPQIVQVSLDMPLSDMKAFDQRWKSFQQVFESLQIECH